MHNNNNKKCVDILLSLVFCGFYPQRKVKNPLLTGEGPFSKITLIHQMSFEEQPKQIQMVDNVCHL